MKTANFCRPIDLHHTVEIRHSAPSEKARTRGNLSPHAFRGTTRKAGAKGVHILALSAFLCSAALPPARAAAPANLPLEHIRTTTGAAPRVTAAANGFQLHYAGQLDADVKAPADAFLCRVAPPSDSDVVQLSIGRVESSLCNALFSPRQDLAISFDPGSSASPRGPASIRLHWAGNHYHIQARGPFTIHLHPRYMQSERGLKWFKPLDKSRFPRAPAGWCSWYIYWQGVTEKEIVKNTDWLAKNLEPFGCKYDQIDDGWQGVGHGAGENRDWYVTDKLKFPHGMKWLASYIRSKGLTPGLWLIPFATSNQKLFHEHPEMFIRKPDGTSIFETRDPKTGKVKVDWTGRFIVDPTSAGGRQWFKDLFRMICLDWGYDYVKIDGQGGSQGACASGHAQLANPSLAPDQAYRAGLATIKSVMGPNRFLLNCGGQWDSVGYCNGIRIGGDVGPSWAGMQPAIRATMAHLFLNNICFWTDPDVVCVRPRGNNGSSLSLAQARVWATLVGITGQLLMASDKMYDLPPSRVELLRRIFPVADIRPMDLYPLSGKPHLFDLRIAKPGVGDWDVVAAFNWNTTDDVHLRVDPRALGLPAGRYEFYDVWNKQLVSVTSRTLALTLKPTSCRVLCIRRFSDHPQLLGTSRHLTQGADDLIRAAWDADSLDWQGESKVVGGDPYQIRFSLPPGWSCEDAAARIQGPVAVITLRHKTNRTTSWRIHFKRVAVASSLPAVEHARLRQANRSVTLSWSGANAIGYRIYRNGKLIDNTGATHFTDYLRGHGKTYRYQVTAVGWGELSAPANAGEVTVQAPPRGTAKDIWLDQLAPISAAQDYGRLRSRKSVDGHPLHVGGRQFAHGLGTHANSELLYRLANKYQRFQAFVGVDDEKNGAGTVEFQVFTDGVKVFDSGVMHGGQPAKQVNVSLNGVDELQLVAKDGGDGINSDHADWGDARLLGNH